MNSVFQFPTRTRAAGATLLGVALCGLAAAGVWAAQTSPGGAMATIVEVSVDSTATLRAGERTAQVAGADSPAIQSTNARQATVTVGVFPRPIKPIQNPAPVWIIR